MNNASSLKKYLIIAVVLVIVVASFMYIRTMDKNSSYTTVSFDEVIEKLVSMEPFYLYISFEEDPNTEEFISTITSITNEKGVKIYHTENDIFRQAEGKSGANLVKTSVIQYYANGSMQKEIHSGASNEEYYSFFNTENN